MVRDGLDKPLWQVSLYIPDGGEGRAHLTLSVDHALIDGKGVQILLAVLLMDDIGHLPSEDLGKIPRLEDTVNLHPELPTSDTSLKPPWPLNNPVITPPTSCEPVLSILNLSTNLLDQLKTIGKVHGTPTLHPILLLSCTIAIWSVISPDRTELPLLHATPISVRDPTLNHAYCTANYTANCGIRSNIASNLDFWAEASRISEFLRSPQGRDLALSAKGQLSNIPDHDDPNRSPEFVTGWEEFYLTRARSEKPFGAALGLSNLGYMKLPSGAEDMCWSQMVSPFSPVLTVCLVSTERGSRAVSGWREGSVLRTEQVRDIEVVWRRVLDRLVDEDWGGGTAVGNLVK